MKSHMLYKTSAIFSIPILMMSMSSCQSKTTHSHTSTHTSTSTGTSSNTSENNTQTSSNTTNANNTVLEYSHASNSVVQEMPAAGTCHYQEVNASKGVVMPDPKCTPGALNPQVTQSTIKSTICQKGWTTTVRPKTSVTNKEKVASAKAYSYSGAWKVAELDHFIPIELGGATNDARNLWIEPNKSTAHAVNNPKDPVENTLKRAICNGKITLAQGQNAMAHNWDTALKDLGLTVSKNDDGDGE